MAAFTQRGRHAPQRTRAISTDPTDVESVMRTIFRRCLKCSNEAPSCAALNCGDGMICIQTPPSCDACASVACRADPALGGSTNKGTTNVGAIAGGVIGGVVFIAVLVWVIWKFCLKGKRQQYAEGDWQEVDLSLEEKTRQENDFASRRSARASTHTVASMASSVLTRASNIIQIAYIPGVTNRSGPGSPDVLVPPVPPIPAMSPSTGLSSPYANSEQHYFVPDLRSSMASGMTGVTDARSSYAARQSIAPSLARNSVASTVYRQNAIVSPLPAQTIVRGKAAVVSVKSNSTSPVDSPSSETPPVPQLDSKYSAVRIQMPRQGSGPSPGSSIRSTATLGPVRALNITKKKSFDATPPRSSHSNTSGQTGSTSETLVPPGRPLTDVSMASTDDGVAHARARRAMEAAELSDSDSDDDDHSRARRSLLHDSQITDIHDTPLSLQSPFSDSSSIDSRPDMPQRHTSNSSALRGASPMTPIREEGSKRGSLTSTKRTASPFSDDNRSEL
jgi:hypothetical protein